MISSTRWLDIGFQISSIPSCFPTATRLIDVLVANSLHNDGVFVYVNDGGGSFSRLDLENTPGATILDVFAGGLYGTQVDDFDGDGDLDIYASQQFASGSEIWLNDGQGTFIDSGQRLSFDGGRPADTNPRPFVSTEVGDIDGDGDLDILEVFGTSVGGGRLWLNNAGEPEVSLRLEPAVIGEAAGTAALSADLSSPHTEAVTVELDVSGTATIVEDYLLPQASIVIAAGETTASMVITAVQDTLDEPDETIVVEIASVNNGRETASQRVTLTIVDDDSPSTLQVTDLMPTPSGFVVEFGSSLDTSDLTIYTSQAGILDVVLEGETVGAVSGSLVVSPSLQMVRFVKTGGPLEADNYSVTFRSGDTAFKSTAGSLLDGNGDGTPGDHFQASFVVPVQAANAVTIGLPDFVRGPGQPVKVPATGLGIPVTISEGVAIRSVNLAIRYDSSLLQVTGATLGEQLPAGTTIAFDSSTPGLAVVTIVSGVDFPAGPVRLVNLEASVPAANEGDTYLRQQVVSIESVVIQDSGSNNIPAIADDALHVVQYFSDVSGNRRINASDAAAVARVAALVDTGFSATPLTDPQILGDVTANGRLNAADASLVARFAALFDVPQIPPIADGKTIIPPSVPRVPNFPPNSRSESTHRVAETSPRAFPPLFRNLDTNVVDAPVDSQKENSDTASRSLTRETMSHGEIDAFFAELGKLAAGL